MILQKLKQLLDKEDVDYQIVPHQEDLVEPAVSASHKIPAHEIAKVHLVRAGDHAVMVVLPSTYQLDLEKLAVLFDADLLFMEDEAQASRLFPDCERGAYPALGCLYDLPCYVDETLLDGGEVFFDGGNPREFIRVSSDEYWRIARAEIGDFRLRR